MLRPSALVLLLLAPAALAQTPARRDTLPPLAPQDLEIRGQLRVRLPSIPRQPLGGIAPVQPPRRLDPQRTAEPPTPYAAPPLPETPLARFDPPALPGLTAGPPQRAALEGGAGRFFQRFGRLYAAGPVAANARFYLSGLYDGADGERLDTARRGYNEVRTTAGLLVATARADVAVEGGGFYRDWAMPVGADRGARRSGTGGHARMAVEATTPRGIAVRASATPTFASFDLAGQAKDETRVAVAGGVDVPLGALGVWLDASGATADRTGQDPARAASVGVGVEGQRGVVAYRVGPRVLFYRAATGATSQDETALSADVDVSAALAPALTLRLTNTPSAPVAPLADVLADAPYLVRESVLQAEAIPVDARLRADATRGGWTVSPWVGALYARRYQHYVSSGARLDVAYGRVAGMQAGLGLRYASRSGLGVSGEAVYRSVGFVDADGAAATVPYLAPVTGRLHVAYGLPGGGIVQASLVGEGVRFGGAGETLRLRPLLDLDLHAAVSVRGPLFVVLRADRVLALGRTRFHGHPETTGLVSGGLGIRW